MISSGLGTLVFKKKKKKSDGCMSFFLISFEFVVYRSCFFSGVCLFAYVYYTYTHRRQNHDGSVDEIEQFNIERSPTGMFFWSGQVCRRCGGVECFRRLIFV